ncbi:hypothetical protein B0H14DRAFT_3474880 [Mycena olivaceomarginata]|nr:hypothetical protein B0H14DRAFT_3474880 [Mycena olivaceomarginata]
MLHFPSESVRAERMGNEGEEQGRKGRKQIRGFVVNLAGEAEDAESGKIVSRGRRMRRCTLPSVRRTLNREPTPGDGGRRLARRALDEGPGNIREGQHYAWPVPRGSTQSFRRATNVEYDAVLIIYLHTRESPTQRMRAKPDHPRGRLAWVMKNSRRAPALREEDGETGREIDTGGAHCTRDTDVERTLQPRENDAHLDIYWRSVAQRMLPSPTAEGEDAKTCEGREDGPQECLGRRMRVETTSYHVLDGTPPKTGARSLGRLPASLTLPISFPLRKPFAIPLREPLPTSCPQTFPASQGATRVASDAKHGCPRDTTVAMYADVAHLK